MKTCLMEWKILKLAVVLLEQTEAGGHALSDGVSGESFGGS